MNSLQLKKIRRNNAQKVHRPSLYFKASKEKAKDRRKSSSNDQNQEGYDHGFDAHDNVVIIDHASVDDDDDDDPMNDAFSDSQGSNRSSFDYGSGDSDDEHFSFESKLKLVDFDIHEYIKDVFLKFTDSYDAWMNRLEYEDQKLSDRYPFTVQQFSEEFSAILAKQIVQKGTDTELLSLLKRFVPDVNWPVRVGKYNSCYSNMDTFKEVTYRTNMDTLAIPVA